MNYLTTMTSEDEPCGVEVLERGVALTAVLGDREELENEERKAMRDLGLRYRGRWPIFRSIMTRGTGHGTSTPTRPDF